MNDAAAAVPTDAMDGCAEHPVLRERGQREVFCGLTGIVWLHRKIQDAFFLVVGSRTCAHLIQSAAGVMIFAEPRFATAIIDERDLAGLADANDELDRVVTQLLERRPDIKLLFLVGSCPSEVIKLDLTRAAQRLGQRLRARMSGCWPIPAAGSKRPSRKARMPAWPRWCPACRLTAERRACWWSARWPMSSRISLRACSTRSASPRCASCRRGAPPTCPGRARHALSAGAAVPGDTARALEERGARRIAAPFPLGAEGTTLWLRAAADAFGVDARALRGRHGACRDGVRRHALARHRDRLAGKRIFLFPDSQLEIPLARFLARELSMHIVEVGTPYLHRQHPGARNSRCCPRMPRSAKVRTSSGNSTAAGARDPISSCAAWVWRIRSRPRA